MLSTKCSKEGTALPPLLLPLRPLRLPSTASFAYRKPNAIIAVKNGVKFVPPFLSFLELCLPLGLRPPTIFPVNEDVDIPSGTGGPDPNTPFTILFNMFPPVFLPISIIYVILFIFVNKKPRKLQLSLLENSKV